MKKNIFVIAVFVLASAVALPFSARAITSQEANAIQSQITQTAAELQRIQNAVGSVNPTEPILKKKEYCYQFGRTIQKGNTGQDVNNLNRVLKVKGYDVDENSDVFSDKTENAVRAYQEKNPEILKRAGISQATGVFGPTTRSYVAQTFGCGDVYGKPSDNSNSVLLGRPNFYDKPRPTLIATTLNADVNGDGKVDIEDLSAVIAAWGKCPTSNLSEDTTNTNTKCSADINRDGIVDRTDLEIVIKYWGKTSNTGTPTIRVISPNGGETWKAGETQIITWETENISNSLIGLFLVNTSGQGFGFDANVNPTTNDGTQKVVVPNVPTGKYKVYIKAYAIGSIDYSDDYFTVVSGTQGVTGDVNGDGVVNVDDLLLVINHWGPCSVNASASAAGVPTVSTSCAADLNHDGVVNSIDLDIVTKNWTGTTPTTQSAIKVTSPNGGETWGIGSNQKIKWTGGVSTDMIGLTLMSAPGANLPNPDIVSMHNTGAYNWIIPSYIVPGSYIIRACILDGYDNSGNSIGEHNCVSTDYSNANFTIVNTQILPNTNP